LHPHSVWTGFVLSLTAKNFISSFKSFFAKQTKQTKQNKNKTKGCLRDFCSKERSRCYYWAENDFVFVFNSFSANGSKNKKVVVADVNAFPGHISCDSDSKSEIVIPIFGFDNNLIGVLDIDSSILNCFNQTDVIELDSILKSCFCRPTPPQPAKRKIKHAH
jgi:hypothetical protein